MPILNYGEDDHEAPPLSYFEGLGRASLDRFRAWHTILNDQVSEERATLGGGEMEKMTEQEILRELGRIADMGACDCTIRESCENCESLSLASRIREEVKKLQRRIQGLDAKPKINYGAFADIGMRDIEESPLPILRAPGLVPGEELEDMVILTSEELIKLIAESRADAEKDILFGPDH